MACKKEITETSNKVEHDEDKMVIIKKEQDDKIQRMQKQIGGNHGRPCTLEGKMEKLTKTATGHKDEICSIKESTRSKMDRLKAELHQRSAPMNNQYKLLFARCKMENPKEFLVNCQ